MLLIQVSAISRTNASQTANSSIFLEASKKKFLVKSHCCDKCDTFFGPGPGLPDGLFSNQKSKFGRALEWKMPVFFMTILECFTVIWHILWPFGNVVVIWFIFPRFGILCREISGNPTPASFYSLSAPRDVAACSTFHRN
jgi:hypothetical protein